MGRVKHAKTTNDTPALEAAFELLDQLPVPMFYKARDGRYLGVNKAWEELFGHRRAACDQGPRALGASGKPEL